MPFEHLVRPAMQANAGVAERPVVLCVEDDAKQSGHLVQRLIGAGYDAVAVDHGAAAEAALIDTAPHAILLDLGLPDIDGLELCRRFVEWPACPVIVVSADLVQDRIVAALDLGARDYVTKPYNTEVLIARLRAALRDRSPARRVLTDDILTLGDVTLDIGAHELHVAGRPVPLHARPFALLEQLLRHDSMLLPYAVLVGKRRGDPVGDADLRALRIAIGRVRKALGTGPHRPIVATEARVGYRLLPPAE